MSFSEDVTRHSVHTLVFRSLKRTHDMFLSDAGDLPSSSSDGAPDALWRKAKARATYGPVMQRVDAEKNR